MSGNNSSHKSGEISILDLYKNAYKGFFTNFKEFCFYGFFITFVSVVSRVFTDVVLPIFLEETDLEGVSLGLFIFLIIVLIFLISFVIAVFSELIYKSIAKAYLNDIKPSISWYWRFAVSNFKLAFNVFLKTFWYVCKWMFLFLVLAGIFAVIINLIIDYWGDSVWYLFLFKIASWLIPTICFVIGGAILIYRSLQLFFVMTAYVEKPRTFELLKKESLAIVKGRIIYIFWRFFLFTLLIVPFFILMALAWVLPWTFSLVSLYNIWPYIIFGSSITMIIVIIISALYSVFMYDFYLKLKKSL